MELVTVDPPSLREWVRLTGHDANAFGPENAGIVWRCREHHVGLRDGDGGLVAVAGATVAQVAVGGAVAFDVVGLGGLIISPGARGRGLMIMLMDGLAALAESLGPDRAMIFCAPALAGIYGRRGYRALADPVRVDQPSGRAELPLVTMWRPLRAGADWPPGPVELAGLPF